MKTLITLNKVLIFSLVCLAAFSCGTKQDETEQKIDDLLSKMTLQEKIGQINQLTGTGLSNDMIVQIKAGNVGSILNEIDAKTINELQRIAVEESRLGIPLVFGRDVIHGFKTIYPIPLGQAATFNPALVEKAARLTAIEATSAGIRWTFAPMIDIARDPRWGRIAESCGEDPHLTSIMGAAMIRGFQSEKMNNPTALAACAKHFAGYGFAEQGRDYNTTWIPELQLREVVLPPFKAAVEAGAATFMCSFNDINGVPSSGNAHLNKDILRDEWQFNGLLVSDWGSIEQMIAHGVVHNLKEAAEVAINAGVDMDMMGFAYINYLDTLIQQGKISEKTIDQAVRNVLRLKFRLGLFENPYTEIQEKLPFYSEEALVAAREAAAESAILLKNDKNILPLNNVKRVAIVGALSDAPADQVGTWCFDSEPEHSVTPLAAIKAEYGDKIQIVAEKGLTYSRDKNVAGIAKAVAAARNADVILYFAGEEALLSGESNSLANLNLQGLQSEMLTALKKTGKPVVLIVMAGRPLIIPEEVVQADAVIYAFHGGTMAGAGLADVIFGKVAPSGKLPVTLPRMLGQVPIYYAQKNTGRPATNMTLIDEIPVGRPQTSSGFSSYHIDAGNTSLFPFGYGLSYTTFEYGNVQLSDTIFTRGGTLTVKCTIKNTGKVDAAETAQLYIRDKVAKLERPVRELRGFEKIFLAAGEEKAVDFTLTENDLAYWNADLVKRAEAGEFQVWVSSNSQSGTPAEFKMEK